MPDSLHKPRVAVLGAREEDMEILAELQRQDQVTLVAVYDPDPHAPGLALAEIVGVPAGADAAARERLGGAEVIVLPTNRRAYQAAIDWCSGLRAELLGADAARQRWGGAQHAEAAASGTAASGDFVAQLAALEQACARATSLSELGEWLLDTCMRAVGASGGSLQMLASDTSELYLIAARGLAEDVLRHSRQPLGEPIAGLVAAMRTPRILQGPQARHLPSQRGAVTSALSIPLLGGAETVVGVLNVSTTVAGRSFGAPELEALQRAAPRLAALLEQARTLGNATRAGEAQLFALLGALAGKGADLASAMTTVARALCEHFDADAIGLHLTTEAGDWQRLAAATRPATAAAPPLSRSLAARALLQQQWVHVAQPAAAVPETGDTVADAVERALSPVDTSGDVRSWVVAPLVGTAPVGVLVGVFSRLATAESFMAQGPPAVRHLALYLETRVRERRLEARLARSTRLARLLPVLLDASARGDFDTVLVREAAILVGAERALLRHVDEGRRTYSRPVMHGVPDTDADAWRSLDARVTESTLQRRRLDVRTLEQGHAARLDQPRRERSLVSLPIQQGDRIVAVLNAYDRLPQDPLEGGVFTAFDADLLQTFGNIAAALWPHRSAAGAAASALPPPTGAADNGPSASDSGAKRLREELHREIARAERHQRPLTLALLHVKGLDAVGEPERTRLLGHIDRLLRDFVRRSDLVGWYGPDRLLIVSPEADARGNELEVRIRQLLQQKLPDTSALDVRLGTSGYPRDGSDAATLLQAAVSRLA